RLRDLAGSGRAHAAVRNRRRQNLSEIRCRSGTSAARRRPLRRRTLTTRHSVGIGSATDEFLSTPGEPMSLLAEMNQKALNLGLPISVQLDITYRCNERCVHCYLNHDDHGEMTTQEIIHLLDEMADAGVFILTLSGGEIFLRKDFFTILEHARRLMFCVKLKTNAVLIR